MTENVAFLMNFQYILYVFFFFWLQIIWTASIEVTFSIYFNYSSANNVWVNNADKSNSITYRGIYIFLFEYEAHCEQN